ncbi:MAG: hypothetical protein QOH13_1066 [Thermoleophilaceae bacterium]|nr:hypothetical protein [Thermoleophilaceae bacterium]
MNVALIVAGSLAVLAAAVHGAAGEVLVVRKLTAAELPPTRFGGPVMTKAMIHVTWHIATVAFFTVGCALVVSGAALDGDSARGIALVAAVAATGFAAVATGLGLAYTRTPRAFLRHPGPVVLSAAAVLAWLGAL